MRTRGHEIPRHMDSGGLFIVLYDEATLDLYLNENIYGFLLTPEFQTPSSRSVHYRALADYACAREGTHVLFFWKRRIVYAGQIVGNRDIGSFYLNGKTSPLGREANSNLVWDESRRYRGTDKEGVFVVNDKEKCQPVIVLFKDTLGLQRKQISSDDLYFELGSYPYPLPSNAIQNMGFCTLTPGETQIALKLYN